MNIQSFIDYPTVYQAVVNNLYNNIHLILPTTYEIVNLHFLNKATEAQKNKATSHS